MITKEQALAERKRLDTIRQRKIKEAVHKLSCEAYRLLDSDIYAKKFQGDSFEATFVSNIGNGNSKEVLKLLTERLKRDYAKAWPEHVLSVEPINGSGIYVIQLYKPKLLTNQPILIGR